MNQVNRVPLLDVRELTIAYGKNRAVHGVDFTLDRGGSLALIGESGSGKSTIAKAVLRLLPAAEASVVGRVGLDGVDVLSLADEKFRALRGRTLGFIPQDPATGLNPVRTVGAQALEAAALAGEHDARGRRRAAIEVFSQVGLPDPERVFASYPHQLSGGMLQRVLIGLAVLPKPSLIVADEPTSALDVTIQKRILDLLTGLQKDLGISLLLITHDLAIASQRTDALVVLRGGAVEESGPSRTVLAEPRSAYARRLRADVPALNPDRYRRGAGVARLGAPAQIEVAGVSKSYARGAQRVSALEDVSFSIPAGSTHALVGESGSGKTTAVRLLLGLENPDSGEISVAGAPVHGRGRRELRAIRRQLQLVYQNPFTSLDPTWRVERVIGEPVERFRAGDRFERARRVADAAAAVRLPVELLGRRATHLSGGQRQRVAIARALVLRPDVVVLDEPTSALDVSVQAGIVDLLSELQRELGLTYLFVSHDLALVRQIADTVTVLRRGRTVESGPVERIFSEPRDPYTRTLIDSIPAAS